MCNLCFNYLLIVKRVPKKAVVDQSTENVNITGSERYLRWYFTWISEFSWQHRDSTYKHLVHKRTLECLMFIYELSCCGLECCCCHLNFRYRVCFGQGLPWHSGNYRVQIHSEALIGHDNNIQSKRLDWKINNETEDRIVLVSGTPPMYKLVDSCIQGNCTWVNI